MYLYVVDISPACIRFQSRGLLLLQCVQAARKRERERKRDEVSSVPAGLLCDAGIIAWRCEGRDPDDDRIGMVYGISPQMWDGMSGNWDKVVVFYSVLLSFSLLAFTRRRGPGIVYFPGPDELAERKGEKREEGEKNSKPAR